MLEAAEQSWNLFVPNLIVLKRIEELFNFWFFKYFLTDFGEEEVKCKVDWKSSVFIVGPEGGFEDNERKFLYSRCKVVSLWKNVLRSETASVVCGWLLGK
jgi:RsmE family RNA methyltransferase